MNDKAITILAVRLIGLYCIVLAISTLPGNLSMISSNLNDPTSRAVFIAGTISTIWSLLVGVGLWYFSIPLGRLIAGKLPSASVEREFPLESVQKIAVSLFGLFVLTSAVPDLFCLIISWLFPKINPRYVYSFGLHGETKAEIPLVDLLKVGIQLVMGFWLLLGSHSLVTAIRSAWKKEMTT